MKRHRLLFCVMIDVFARTGIDVLIDFALSSTRLRTI